MTAPGRYTGDLAELRGHPRFDYRLDLMQAYLRELALRGADRYAEQARRLEAAGAPHLQVMLALAGAENAARDHPGYLAPYRAATGAYAREHGLRGWYRGTDGRGRPVVQVSRVRTAAGGDVGRYHVHRPLVPAWGEPKAWVVDRDSGETAARFGVGMTVADAQQMARSWIYTAEAGGC